MRAYSRAVQEGLRQSAVIEKEPGTLLGICTDYNGVGKIQYLLGKEGVRIVESQYTDKVELQALVPEARLKGLKESITEATNGKALFPEEKPVTFAFLEGEPLIYPDERTQQAEGE